MSAPTVLLVEDNPISRKIVRVALENAGLNLLEAPDGATALQMAGRRAPNLILQDLVLPDIDGFELVHMLRDCLGDRSVPIIAFSGLVTQDHKLAAAGFDDVIAKPIEPSRLVQLVKSHLAADRVPPPVAGDGSRRVLLVDDDPAQRKLVAFRLKRLGFEVVTASDGVDALEVLSKTTPPPEIIISDVLMPRLDGFGLCIELRGKREFDHIPIVLTTNSYLDDEDRELARRAGANDLIVRTPDLDALMEAIENGGNGPGRASAGGIGEDIERQRMRRVTSQLERQVALNAGVSQRCSLLAAELTVLRAISEALADHDDIDSALRHAIAACFDAGGVSIGALYLRTGDELRSIGVGFGNGLSERDLNGFFGEASILEEVLSANKSLTMTREGASAAQRKMLDRAKAASALLIPLSLDDQVIGALLMMSRGHDMTSPDRAAFGHTVASQIAQALAVARAFDRSERAERAAREAEQTAQEQASVLQSILDSIADAVVVCDVDGNFIHWNPAADKILRKGPLAVPPSKWSVNYGLFEADRVTPLSVDRLPLARAMQGENVNATEIFMRHDGVDEGAWISVNARPWLSDTGEVMGGVAAFRDITTEKATQSRLLASDRMASVGLIAAGVAHELNNPLAALLANLELADSSIEAAPSVSETPEISELRQLLRDAREAADRMNRIVRDLRVFSRREETESAPVHLQPVVESAVRMAWNEIRHRARLVTDFRDDGPVLASDSRLGQVVLNLLVNAAHAVDDGNVDDDTITIVTRSDGKDSVILEISDTGQGISPEHRAQLFTPFFTTKASGTGTGLGLAICDRIVRDLGGTIEVDSTVGVGTTFRIRLPRGAKADSPEVDEEKTQELALRTRGRVLVLDDEPSITRVVARILGKHHDVVTMNRGKEALGLIESDAEFDVIFCDLMMPELTGPEFYARVEQHSPTLASRIVFLTGGAFSPATREFLEEQRNACIEKPFHADELRRFVDEKIATLAFEEDP